MLRAPGTRIQIPESTLQYRNTFDFVYFSSSVSRFFPFFLATVVLYTSALTSLRLTLAALQIGFRHMPYEPHIAPVN
jgi:hypothetical protein